MKKFNRICIGGNLISMMMVLFLWISGFNIYAQQHNYSGTYTKVSGDVTKTDPATSQGISPGTSSSNVNLSTNQTTQISNEEAGDETYGYKFRKPAGNDF